MDINAMEYCPNDRSLQGRSLEYALYDVLDNIFKFLNMKDLVQAARVSKSWNSVASREISKRWHIQRALIPRKTGYHVPNILTVKPHVALLFMSCKWRQHTEMSPNSNKNILEHEIMTVYKKQFPDKLICMEVQEFLQDEDVQYSSADLQGNFALESTGDCGILGLFLPVQSRIHIHVTWCKYGFESVTDLADRMVHKLAFDRTVLGERPRSAVLLFAQSVKGYFIAEQFMRNVRRRFDDDRETFWGGVFNKELVATDCEEGRPRGGQKALAGLRISSPSLESWTTTIDCCDKRPEIDRKLWEFSERVQRKRYNLGLVYGPRYARSSNPPKRNYHDSYEFLKAIKRILPMIPFVGLFNNDCKVLTDEYTPAHDSQMIDTRMLMSIVVISYD